MLENKVETLYSGTKVGTGSLCAPAFPLFPRSFTHNQLLHIPITPCYAPFAKMVSAEGAKWTKDNLGTQSVDKAPFSAADPDIQMGRVGGGGGGRSSRP